MFRWGEGPSGWEGWIGSRPVRVAQWDGKLFFSGASREALRRYFSIDADLPAILRGIDVDPHIHAAIAAHRGLRIIRQEPWECLASFILSAFNNIPRLTGMIERLSERYGERADAVGPGTRWYLAPTCPFPRPEALAGVTEGTLRACGLGYRAGNLRKTAREVASGRADLEAWRRLEDAELRERLLGLPGVGQKVMECVMLFGYARASAFPVDVWIRRAMERGYFRGKRVTDRRIREFARRHFGPECGWAQQYLFCRARSKIGTRYRVPGTWAIERYRVPSGSASRGRRRPR